MSLLKFIRHCAFCQCWPNLYSEILCKKCWTELLSESECNLSSHNYPFQVYRLWVWSGINQRLYLFLHSLKNGWAQKVLKDLAQYFLAQRTIEQDFKSAVIVPSPRKTGQKKDHAMVFAKHLSEQSSIPLKDILQRGSNQEFQKQKTLQERSQVKMNLLQQESLENVIFVDDVITSGSTVMAAYKALGFPRNFQVWVLAERLKK